MARCDRFEPMPEHQPHWEHGYRGHGYWFNHARLGYVGLGPRGLWDGWYRWHVSTRPVVSIAEAGGVAEEGRARTLRTAKRCVERACQRLYGNAPQRLPG